MQQRDGYIYRNNKVVGSLVGTQFCKWGVNERKHLLHSRGDVPCIDASAWDEVKEFVTDIRIVTDKREFRVSKEVFDENKKSVNFGWGEQYYIDRELWIILVREPALA